MSSLTNSSLPSRSFSLLQRILKHKYTDTEQNHLSRDQHGVHRDELASGNDVYLDKRNAGSKGHFVPTDRPNCLSLIERILIELRTLRKNTTTGNRRRVDGQNASSESALSGGHEGLLWVLEAVLESASRERFKNPIDSEGSNSVNSAETRLLSGCVRELINVLDDQPFLRTRSLRILCRLVEPRRDGTAFSTREGINQLVLQNGISRVLFSLPLVDDEGRKYALRVFLAYPKLCVSALAKADAGRVLVPLMEKLVGAVPNSTADQKKQNGHDANCVGLLATMVLQYVVRYRDGVLGLFDQSSVDDALVTTWTGVVQECIEEHESGSGGSNPISASSSSGSNRQQALAPLTSILQALCAKSPALLTRVSKGMGLQMAAILLCAFTDIIIAKPKRYSSSTNEELKVTASITGAGTSNGSNAQDWRTAALDSLARLCLTISLHAASSTCGVTVKSALFTITKSAVRLLDHITTAEPNTSTTSLEPDTSSDFFNHWWNRPDFLFKPTFLIVLLDLIVNGARTSPDAFTFALTNGALPLMRLVLRPEDIFTRVSCEKECVEFITEAFPLAPPSTERVTSAIQDRSFKLLQAFFNESDASADRIQGIFTDRDEMDDSMCDYVPQFISKLVHCAAAEITDAGVSKRNAVSLAPFDRKKEEKSKRSPAPRALRLLISLSKTRDIRLLIAKADAASLIALGRRHLDWMHIYPDTEHANITHLLLSLACNLAEEANIRSRMRDAEGMISIILQAIAGALHEDSITQEKSQGENFEAPTQDRNSSLMDVAADRRSGMKCAQLAFSLMHTYRFDLAALSLLCSYPWSDEEGACTSDAMLGEELLQYCDYQKRKRERIFCWALGEKEGHVSLMPLLFRILAPNFPNLSIAEGHTITPMFEIFARQVVLFLDTLVTPPSGKQPTKGSAAETAQLYITNHTTAIPVLTFLHLELESLPIRDASAEQKGSSLIETLIRIVARCLTRPDRLKSLVLGDVFARAVWPLVVHTRGISSSSMMENFKVTSPSCDDKGLGLTEFEVGGGMSPKETPPSKPEAPAKSSNQHSTGLPKDFAILQCTTPRNETRPLTSVYEKLMILRSAFSPNVVALERIVTLAAAGGEDAVRFHEHAVAALAVCCPPQEVRNRLLQMDKKGGRRTPPSHATQTSDAREPTSISVRDRNPSLMTFFPDTLHSDAPIAVLVRMLCLTLEFSEDESKELDSTTEITPPRHSTRFIAYQRRRTAALAIEIMARAMAPQWELEFDLLMDSYTNADDEIARMSDALEGDNDNVPAKKKRRTLLGTSDVINEMNEIETSDDDDIVRFRFPDDNSTDVPLITSRSKLGRVSEAFRAMLLGAYAERVERDITIRELGKQEMNDLISFVDRIEQIASDRSGMSVRDACPSSSVLRDENSTLLTLVGLVPSPGIIDMEIHWPRVLRLLACADRFLVDSAKGACEIWLLRSLNFAFGSFARTRSGETERVKVDETKIANSIAEAWLFCTKLYLGRAASTISNYSSRPIPTGDLLTPDPVPGPSESDLTGPPSGLTAIRNPVAAVALRILASTMTASACDTSKHGLFPECDPGTCISPICPKSATEPILVRLWADESEAYLEAFADGLAGLFADVHMEDEVRRCLEGTRNRATYHRKRKENPGLGPSLSHYPEVDVAVIEAMPRSEEALAGGISPSGDSIVESDGYSPVIDPMWFEG